MKQLTVLLVFGGESSEHDVSLQSARNVYAALNKHTYSVILAYIDRSGTWWLLDEWTETPEERLHTQLLVLPGAKAVVTVPSNTTIAVNVLFPVLHGKMGEDGTIQGLAAMAHIPIVGCNVESSAICMDKHAAKLLIEASGVPVVPWIVVRRGDEHANVIKRIKRLDSHGPWFVKPSRAGSSVGVSKVKDAAKLWEAVTVAHEHDDIALVETAVVGRELEVAVLGNPPNHKASGVGEIIPGSDFYDYDDKYSTTSTSQTLLDAKLPKELSKVIRQLARDTYQILGCTGLARVDFLLSDELIPYVNEVNTLPGFTDISMYPKLWEAKGLTNEVLVERLIQLALE